MKITIDDEPLELPDFALVTGNPDKRREVERILGAPVEVVDVDLPEIQSDDLLEVLRAKADTAWSHLARPLVVEETGLELECMGGFPGPLVKWMLRSMGAEGIARTAIALGDPRVRARCALEFRDGERRVVGEGVTTGRLVLPPRGQGGFGWDPVFEIEVPSESGLASPPVRRTYAELGETAKDQGAHRGLAWRDLVRKLG